MTAEVKHTPRPWAYRESKEDCCDFEVYSGEGQSVDIVAGEYGIESEDDARLIAAAPELLSTLREIAGNGHGAGRNPQLMVDAALAAIAKVEGRS